MRHVKPIDTQFEFETKKIYCIECGREITLGTRPDGLPNGVGFELEDGTIIPVCSDCILKEDE